jgi:tetratricopeptide (TPR) repeat protein
VTSRLILLVCCLLLVPGAVAQTKEAVVGMSKKTYDVLNEIQPLVEAEQWQEATDILTNLRRDRKLSGYETAHVLNMLGYIYFQQDRIQDALASYSDALTQEGLPESQVRALLNAAAQVSMASGDFVAAEKYAKQLIAAETEAPQPLSQIILAQAYVGQERWADALAPLKKAVQMQKDMGSRPRENWLVLLSSVYYYLGDFREMRDLLYEIVTLYPRERYIINLAALHGELEEPEKQLALVESLRDDERLHKDFHLKMLASLYISQGVPLKAAQLLEKEIAAGNIEATRQNLEMQSQAWYMAGNEAKAITPLEAIAESEDDGKLYVRIARLYMDLYQFKSAEKAARKALATDELKERGDAWLLVGMALARRDQLEASRKAFVEAARHDSSEKWARQWLKFVDNEQARLASLTSNPS